jgi:hypothetical protein
MTLAQILPIVLVPYENQQRRVLAEFGGDEAEVLKRVAKMRDWVEFCMTERREIFRERRAAELFGRAEALRVEAIPGHKCELCHGAGMCWSDACTPRQRNQAGRSESGFVVCRCQAGKVKNRAIAMHGRSAGKTTRRGVQAEEF